MAQETNVNRTPLSHGLVNDIAEVETETGENVAELFDETQHETPTNTVQTDKFNQQFAEIEKQAQARIAEQAGSDNLKQVQPKLAPEQILRQMQGDKHFDEIDRVIDQVVEQAAVELGLAAAEAINEHSYPVTQTVNTGLVELEEPVDLVVSEEFDQFKAQVVRAFKELGLDTRKFFGS